MCLTEKKFYKTVQKIFVIPKLLIQASIAFHPQVNKNKGEWGVYIKFYKKAFISLAIFEMTDLNYVGFDIILGNSCYFYGLHN